MLMLAHVEDHYVKVVEVQHVICSLAVDSCSENYFGSCKLHCNMWTLNEKSNEVLCN